MTTAASLYDEFVLIIDEAASARDIYKVPRAAEQKGLSGGETQRGFGQRWEYTFVDPAGPSLIIECRWWDQSKAFSIRPDMHVMTATLALADDKRLHERRYEE